MSFRSGAATARAFARAAAVKVEAPAVLTCSVSGGMATGNPNQPVDRDEVIAEALAAAAAGASVLHIHARTTAGELTQASADYLAIKQAIRGEVEDVVLNFSTGGELDAPPQARLQPLSAQPDLATVNCGSMNFGLGEEVMTNPRSLIGELVEELGRREIVPEYECFDLGMALTAASLATSASGAPGVMHMILGSVGGAPASADVISLFARLVPEGVPWAVTAIPRHFAMMAHTLALGGHVRTGLEDVVYTAPGEHAESNAQLITRARALCDAIGRPVATPAQAREILGVATVGPSG